MSIGQPPVYDAPGSKAAEPSGMSLNDQFTQLILFSFINEIHDFAASSYNGPFPGMPFNMCMTFPVEHKIKETKYGLRLCPEPIEEVEILHDQSIILENK